ncbi:MAG: hypothetical protein IT287_04665 [Bdellovibrionaceae bacterium]|nr:hypothetical protein [Pseudobdellovibrionaceae bacterium]
MPTTSIPDGLLVQNAMAIVPTILPTLSEPHTIPVDSYLASRVSSGAVEAIKNYGCEFFCGDNQEKMLNHYKNIGFDKCYQISSNTSTKVFLFTSTNTDESRVVMSGIKSTTRVRHQLLQLHFSEVDVEKIKMVGSIYDLKQQEITALKNALTSLPAADAKILYIGGRWRITEQIARYINKLPEDLDEAEAYKTVSPVTREVGGFIFDTVETVQAGKKYLFSALRMPNGDLAYDSTKAFLESGFSHVIMCGAGGSTFGTAAVGDYVALNQSSYHEETITLEGVKFGSLVSLKFFKQEEMTNTTVDSPLVETQAWLNTSKEEKINTVDVETAHIFRAIKESQVQNMPVSVTAGMFISDVVGEDPLDGKIGSRGTFKQLPKFVFSTLSSILENAIT